MAEPTRAPNTDASLDSLVQALRDSLGNQGVPAPDALLLLATGTGSLEDGFEDSRWLHLAELDACPPPWRRTRLLFGRRADLTLWAIDDLGGDPTAETRTPAWIPALPVWVAAASGARVCVHSSAGIALPGSKGAPFLLANDHINLSGATPLEGLGESTLGPLFPDLGHLHHAGLRSAARTRAKGLGLSIVEGVVACTAGPNLQTPAEARMQSTMGANAAVQCLAPALIACAHAGLATLAVVSLLDTLEDDGAHDVARLTARAVELGPELEQLLLALLPDVADLCDELRSSST